MYKLYDLLRADQLVLVVVSILVLKLGSTLLYSPLRKLPGPWYSKFTRLPLKWSIITGQRIYFVDDLHKRFGPIVQISPDEVAVAGLDNVHKVHKVGSNFNKSDWYIAFTSGPRPGIFAMQDPKEHAARRKLFARAFSKTSLRSHWESVVADKVGKTIAGINDDISRVGEADLMKWWTLFATDVSGHIMFGESFRMLESGQKDNYIEVLEKTMMGIGLGVELPLLSPVLKHVPLKVTQQLFNSKKYVLECGERAVRNMHEAGSSANIFAIMLSEAESGAAEINDMDIQTEAGNLIVAGSGTTAMTLTYLSWAIFRHPKLRKALEDEVDALQGDLTDANLERLPLLSATIEEGLRLYGAAPGNLPRVVPPSGVTMEGHFIPSGTIVSTQSWTLHRDPQLFDDPEVFNPDRFLSASAEASPMFVPPPATQSAMFAFGGGARMCQGIHLAYMQLRYGIAYFLKECKALKLSTSTTPESMVPEEFFFIMPRAHRCLVVPA